MGKRITILGAGLAGLIAAIDLKRHGYEVIVLEKAKEIGGIGAFHPSIHVTPVHLGKASKYIGIDIRPCFYPVGHFRAYFDRTRYHLDPRDLYAVERGS